MSRLLLAAAFLAPLALVQTAGAQTVTQYYVVHDSATKKCMIVDRKPVSSQTTITIAGDGTVYKTRSEAETAMKTTKVCMD